MATKAERVVEAQTIKNETTTGQNTDSIQITVDKRLTPFTGQDNGLVNTPIEIKVYE